MCCNYSICWLPIIKGGKLVWYNVVVTNFRPGRDHRIRLDSEDNPPWVHPYKMDPSQLDEHRRQLDKLHRSGRIRPSSSPYGAGCLLVKKANGKWRIEAVAAGSPYRYPLWLARALNSAIYDVKWDYESYRAIARIAVFYVKIAVFYNKFMLLCPIL